MTVLLHGGVFGGQAEGIPAHGMQYVIAAHPHIAGQRVADGVVAHVSHMKLAARVRQHLQDVILGPIGRIGYVERRVLRPALVPARLDFFGVKDFFGDTSSLSVATSRR